MKVSLLSLLILICAQPLFAQTPAFTHSAPDIPFIEKADLAYGSYRGYATLTLDRTTIKLGEKFTADIRFTDKSGGEYFYNPFLNFLPLPARLAIFDSNKKYIGDLLHSLVGSQKGISSTDWYSIPGECYVGTSISYLMAGYLPEAGYLPPNHLLPPGEYYLQVIYFKAFIMRNPETTVGVQFNPADFYKNFTKNFDRSELFRSNVVKVVFTK